MYQVNQEFVSRIQRTREAHRITSPIKLRETVVTSAYRTKQQKQLEQRSGGIVLHRGIEQDQRLQLSERELREVFQKARRRLAGFTMGSDGRRVTRAAGYAVALETAEGNGRLTIKRAVKYVLRNPALYLGYWRDGATEYIDVVRIVLSRDEALKLATQHHQVAVWDFNTNTALQVA